VKGQWDPLLVVLNWWYWLIIVTWREEESPLTLWWRTDYNPAHYCNSNDEVKDSQAIIGLLWPSTGEGHHWPQLDYYRPVARPHAIVPDPSGGRPGQPGGGPAQWPTRTTDCVVQTVGLARTAQTDLGLTLVLWLVIGQTDWQPGQPYWLVGQHDPLAMARLSGPVCRTDWPWTANTD